VRRDAAAAAHLHDDASTVQPDCIVEDLGELVALLDA
jgi:hypothetical protein